MRRFVMLLSLGLAVSGLGCSSSSPTELPKDAPASADAPERSASEAPRKPRGPRVAFSERSPKVGDPAPAIALDSLAGERVALPGSGEERAAILIFGSFS